MRHEKCFLHLAETVPRLVLYCGFRIAAGSGIGMNIAPKIVSSFFWGEIPGGHGVAWTKCFKSLSMFKSNVSSRTIKHLNTGANPLFGFCLGIFGYIWSDQFPSPVFTVKIVQFRATGVVELMQNQPRSTTAACSQECEMIIIRCFPTMALVLQVVI